MFLVKKLIFLIDNKIMCENTFNW